MGGAMRSIFRLVAKYSAGQRKLYVVCMVLGILIQTIALIQPQYGGELISAVQEGSQTLWIIGVLCVFLLLNALLSMLQQALIGKISQSTVKSTRLCLSRVFFSLPVLGQESKAPGWYSQRITNDTELIKAVTAQTIMFVQSSIMLVGSTVALTAIAPTTFIIGVAFGMASFVFTIFASRPIKSLKENMQECSMAMTINLQESALAGRLLRAYDAWEYSQKKFEKNIEDSYKAGFKMALLNSCLSPIAMVFMQLANIGTILFGAFQVAEGTLQFSGLVMFLMYFSYFSSSVSQITGVFAQIREAEAGDERISELEGLAVGVAGHCGVPKPCIAVSDSPDISFDHVHFHYVEGGEDVLTDVTFDIPCGKTTAIVGASGGGKTTCLGMLEGFYAPCQGYILMNGVDLQSVDIESVRKMAGYIDQGSVAISGTIRSNLRLKGQELSDEAMIAALNAVGLKLHPSTLDYEVGENGSALSGGQKQRLALARAILGDPKILLMDEPTASLDGIAENEINQLIKRNFPHATVVYTAHRLSLILSADWIVVINEGRVVGQGEHDDLMERCPYYQRLVESQNAWSISSN